MRCSHFSMYQREGGTKLVGIKDINDTLSPPIESDYIE